MTQYLVYRVGVNQANQRNIEKMPLVIVEASDKFEACTIAEQNFTFYNNQKSLAILSSKANQADFKSVLGSNTSHADKRVIATVAETLSGWQPLPMPFTRR